MKPAREDQLTPWIYRFFRILLAVGLKIKCRLRVYGYKHVPDTGGLILASNHASFLDPPVIGVATRNRIVRFMARDTLFEHRVLGWLYHRFGVVPLARERGDVGAIKSAIRLLKQGHCVSLFPEGTRSTDGNLQDAKGGIGFLIHKAGVPVVPIYIQGSYEAWPKGARKMRSHPLTVRFGPLIAPSELDIRDIDGKPDFLAIGRHVMSKIAEVKGQSVN